MTVIILIYHVFNILNILSKDITNRIIAMGYPSKSIESIYRNTMSQVEK